MRIGIFLLVFAFVATEAEARKSRIRKPKVSRAQAKTESLAAWPGRFETDSRPQPVGVPEIDRLLADRPCLGVSVIEPDIELVDRALSKDGQPTGVAGAFLGTLDPVQRIRAVAEPLLGTPYRTGGSSEKGIDCSGFVQAVLKGLGQDIQGRSSGEYWKQGVSVDKNHLQTGDLLFFSDHTRSIGHVAIYLADGKFVHATVGKGVIVSQLDEKYYLAHYKGARRLGGFLEKLQDNAPGTSTRKI